MSRVNNYGYGSVLFAACMLGLFVAAVAVGWRYPDTARLAPLLVGGLGILVTLGQVGVEVIESRRRAAADNEPPRVAEADAAGSKGELSLFVAFLLLIAGVLCFGFWIVSPLYIAGFLRFREKLSWFRCVLAGVISEAVIYLVFWQILNIELFAGVIPRWLLG